MTENGLIQTNIHSKNSTLSRTDISRYKLLSKNIIIQSIGFIEKNTTLNLKLLQNKNLIVDLVMTNNEVIKTYNKRFRNKDIPTNVLSLQFFSMAEIKQGLNIPFVHLGELIISIPIAFEEAKTYGITAKEHYSRLVVHGLLHLLGFDHKDDNEALEMLDLEKILLKQVCKIDVDSLVTNYFEEV